MKRNRITYVTEEVFTSDGTITYEYVRTNDSKTQKINNENI